MTLDGKNSVLQPKFAWQKVPATKDSQFSTNPQNPSLVPPLHMWQQAHQEFGS